MSFPEFMQEQIEAIEASGLDPMEWIEKHAEAFRASHPVDSSAA